VMSNRRRLGAAAVLGAAGLAALAARAVPAARMSASLCRAVSKSEIAAVNVNTACSQRAPIALSGFLKISGAPTGANFGSLTKVEWGKLPPTEGAVIANVYAVNPTYLSLATARFMRAGGRKLSVGKWGLLTHYDKGGAGITFGVGNDIVQLSIQTPTKDPLKSKVLMKQRATAIAASIAKTL
jgi:hypothetical protein